MEITKGVINLGGAVSAGLLSFLFGPQDSLLAALLCFVVLDYLTGVIAAGITATVSSAVGAKGLGKKLMLLAVVAVGNILDMATGANGVLRNIVLGFYIANEGISLLENAVRCGVPCPQKLRDVLAQLQDGGKKQSNNLKQQDGQ